MNNQYPFQDLPSGTARLPVVVVTAIASFLIFAVLEYSLPLYFNAVARFPRGVWSQLVLWQVMPWIFTPALAGLLSRRYGERRVWAVALVGQSAVPVILWALPEPWIVRPLAFWYGFTNALMWVGGVSLAQLVPSEQKGLANGLMMMALGLGSFFGPLVGRTLLWRQFVTDLLGTGDITGVGEFLVNLRLPPFNAPWENFRVLFMALSIWALLTAALVWLFGQRPGESDETEGTQTLQEIFVGLRRLLANSRFWALTIPICLLGGPVFQATNQFVKYRAEDVGLIVGAQDRGWVLLQLLRMVMWIPGGLAVGLLAGRRAPGIVAVLVLGIFSICGFGIGLVTSSSGLFVTVALFEFMRQSMRWSNSGYLSEHMPPELRATAIGCSVSLAGVGATLFGALPLSSMDANAMGFKSSQPFYIAGALGLSGAMGLFVFDYFWPIRRPSTIPPPMLKVIQTEEVATP